MQAFTYQKTLLHTLFCLFLKLSKAFSVSLTILSKIIGRNFGTIIAPRKACVEYWLIIFDKFKKSNLKKKSKLAKYTFQPIYAFSVEGSTIVIQR